MYNAFSPNNIIINNMLCKITIVMCAYIKAEILLKNTLNLL